MPLYPALLTAACLCLAVLYRTRWRDYSLPARLARTEKAAGGQPRIAVVIPTADQGAQLAENLPDIFAQEYPDFEVIVADEGSTDDTPEVLEALRQQYDNLRTTSVPATSRYIDRRKLAIALGIRAAHAPWVVLTRADCAPVSRQWLATLARNFTDGTDLVQGYANYADNHTATARRAI
ncbi:MAG: glycosyltransferase [Alloprevotella sp.]|nr:glycosyltransferase [Alloprevotella sp.]